MAISFTRCLTVAPGEPITSRHLRSLAAAANDRIRSGIGDALFRFCMWWYNAFRQVRNPDETGLVFPAQGEWFEIYQHIEPETGIQWPLAEPGDPEGANLANPINAYVFGNPQLLDEPSWLAEMFPMWLADGAGFRPPATLGEVWLLGKLQRGVLDPDTGVQNTPAAAAAQRLFSIVNAYWSPHGKSYGGYFPTPVKLADSCGPTPSTGLGIASFEIKFTALRPDVATAGFHGALSVNADGLPVITYAGSCPSWTTDVAAGHVQWIVEFALATYVGVADGAGGINVDRFPSADWIQGPYEGIGVLSKADGKHLQRALWSFAADFRGTPSQRARDDFEIEDIAFDFQRFLTRQYPLSPNLGVLSGDTIEALYPTAVLSAPANPPHTQPEGSAFRFPRDAAQEHWYRDDFVLAGLFARAKKLAAPCRVEVLNDDQVIATLDLTPENGTAEAMIWLDEAVAPAPLRVRIGTAAQFVDASGSITVEATEQLNYKPEFWDAALVTRLSATRGGDATAPGVDGRGLDTDFSQDISRAFFQYGAILNATTSAPRSVGAWITDHPLYDAFRRLARRCVKILHYRQLVSYEVAGGKSVLRFKRYAYGLNNSRVDCFAGLAPPYDPVTELVDGETYIVRASGGGFVTYRGASFNDGQSFTASSEPRFQSHGDAQVFVKNGIRPAALKKGFSNEWVMQMNTHVYHWSPSSIWKPAAYADYFTWNNRCHFYSGSVTSGNLKRHINNTNSVSLSERPDGTGWDTILEPEAVQSQFISPEAPSGYNYAENSNAGAVPQFFKSCQIYAPPYEIESAEVEFDGAEEIVRLTFKGRFQSHPTAPVAVSADPLSWSPAEVAALAAEDYRTDDNALRECVLHRASGSYQCSWKIGDAGHNSTVQSLPDNPYGSCLPHFFFGKLVEAPYEDNNDTIQSHDSRCLIDQILLAEIWLRAMCEGFIDGQTSTAITCATNEGGLFDYTFENLCFEAFGGKWIAPLALSVDPQSHVGFGPLPNTVIYADVFNRLASCYNLLTRARVMLPFTLECKTDLYVGDSVIDADTAWPGGRTCTHGSVEVVVHTGQAPPAKTLFSAGSWADCGFSTGASSSTNIPGTCSGQDWILRTWREETNWRVNVDPNALEAVPASWRGDIQSLGGFLGRVLVTKFRAISHEVYTAAEAEACPGSFFWNGTIGYTFENPIVEQTDSCQLVSGGVIDPGTPLGGTWGYALNAALQECHVNSSATQVAVTIYSDPGFFIEVPLVDLP